MTWGQVKSENMDAVRHQCMIYEGSSVRYLTGVAYLIAEKIMANMRCLYLTSPAMVAGLRSYLSAAKVNVAECVENGSLVLSSGQGHLRNGLFDPDAMLALLEETVTQTLRDGYAGLFAVGDMSWEFGPERNFEKLREYEEKLERLFTVYPQLQGVCQYQVQTLPVQAAREALGLHRACYINQTLTLRNPSYGVPAQPDNLEAMMARPSRLVAS